MSETTLEEASRCPKCEEPGRFNGDRIVQEGSVKLKVFVCENDRCRWKGESWVVQVNKNGTIPPATLQRPKQFRALPDDGGRTVTAIERQLALETGKGGEINRRY